MAAKRLTKSEMFSVLAQATNLSRSQVADVFAAFAAFAEKQVAAGHEVMLPGLLKITVVKRKATKARDGKNPFTGEPMRIKAKPASKQVRTRPLKNLREAV